MAKLTKEIKDYIQEVKLCVAATADKNGMPNASFKGSLQVLDDEHLIFADIFSAKTRKNLMENNKICIIVGDHKKMVSYQFKGEAELINQGELYDKVCKVIEGMNLNLPKPQYVVKTKITEIFPDPSAQ
ncbi:pyridoxamine 5'-phosphate oxidase family protein [Phosphitispora fastidiosa]|uniref:pyridoxamine 5'-phosphate oxidase family protein n=1 Tax=Phosphitispora fastidiosa TaxID=2837202 RepID=UPI001E3B512B|nr:pyridoxamine 5'-phosphate oxidase family protein [Phosphitispora fastidiosa]MBU7007504.1 putative pyridoxine 5'-phosphate oxidase superfamily flavin-nucleotide-binding protein [Phosphitispora fastidiosa]